MINFKLKCFIQTGCSFVLANARIVDYPIVYCNEAFSKLTGYSRVDIMQKSGTCALFFGENTTNEMKGQLQNALENCLQEQIEMLLYKKNRTQLWLVVAVCPVKNEKEEVVLFLLTFRDITALKTPLDEEESNRLGLSKFAKLARSVTRNRSVLQNIGSLGQSIPGTQMSTLATTTFNQALISATSPARIMSEENDLEKLNFANALNFRKHEEARCCKSDPTSQERKLLGLTTNNNIYSTIQYNHRGNLSFTGFGKFSETLVSDLEKANLNYPLWSGGVPQYKQEAPKTPPHIILHYVPFKTAWDWIILILTGYTAIMVPWNLAFRNFQGEEANLYILVVDSIVDVIFFVDIVLNFHTTFVGPKGEVISDAKIIRINYLKGWFIVDLLSCLPYDVFNAFKPESSQNQISQLFGFLKVVRLLRIGRVTRKIDQYFEYMAASLLLMILFFILLAHFLACIWYYIGIQDIEQEIKSGWIPRLLHDLNRDSCSSLTSNSSEFATNGIELKSVIGAKREMAYITSLYYTLSLITSIGFGNVSATTFKEKLVSILFMLIGAFAYATIFGKVTTIFQSMYATRSRYHDMMASVKDFIKTHSVPKDLAERVIDYVTSTWAITKGIDTAKVLNYCPKDMKADLCIHLNRMVFNEHSAFRLASDGCLRALAVNFNTIHTAPGDLIFHQGESIDQLCFVVSGTLEVIQDEEIVAILGRGDVFGEPFWKDPHRMNHSSATIRALTYCDLHCIKKDCVLQVLDFYSAFANSFARNLILTYDLKTRLIFRKWADVKREQELAEQRRPETLLSEIRADHPVRRMIHRFRQIGSHTQATKEQSRHESPVGSAIEEEELPERNTPTSTDGLQVPLRGRWSKFAKIPERQESISRRNSIELTIGYIGRKFDLSDTINNVEPVLERKPSKPELVFPTSAKTLHNEMMDYLSRLRENIDILSRQMQGLEEGMKNLQESVDKQKMYEHIKFKMFESRLSTPQNSTLSKFQRIWQRGARCGISGHQGISQYYRQDSDDDETTSVVESLIEHKKSPISPLSLDVPTRTSYQCLHVDKKNHQYESTGLEVMQTSQGSGDGLSSLSTLEENSVTSFDEQLPCQSIWQFRTENRKFFRKEKK